MMNARIYIRIFMAILFLGMMPSCTYETIHVGGLDENANVTLTLALGDQAVQVSRATVEDVEPENSISTVDLFFYKANDGESVAPVHIEKKITSISNGKISFSMPTDKFEELFPNNETTTCKVFAIVNRPAENGTYNVLPADATVANLKNMVLYTDFTSDQTSFVMHSNGMVTINRTQTNGLNGTIPVKRVAAKIGFELMFPTNDDETLQNKLIVKNGNVIEWTAAPSDVDVKLYFGSSSTKLGSTTNGELFNVDYTKYTDNLSFYTYPTNWGNDESAHTHLMVKVVWTKYGGSSNNPDDQKTTFYEISNLNPGFEYIEQNHYYIIQQSISILGADSEDEAVELTPCYNVLDWGAAGLSGVLNRNRYLAVDETNVIMNNIFTKRIKFASSDPIDLTSAEVLWHYAGQEEARNLPMVTYTNHSISKVNEETYTLSSEAAVSDVPNRIKGDYVVTIKINNTQKYIEISHALDNSMTKGSDFTKYMINFTVQHHDNEMFKESINITQHPMISVEAEKNSDYVSSTSSGNSYGNGNNKHGGYLIINGYDGSDSWRSSTRWYTIGGWNNSFYINHNPNRYIISISSLANMPNGEDDFKFIIGDPRETTVWGVPNDVNKDDNNESLDYYYRTSRTVAKEMISPEFMVASSYGYCASNITTLDLAEKRCATYQEDGYPAGRWRVPTYAEIKYIVQLSGWGSIPELYNGDQEYWCVNGKVPNSGNTFYENTTTIKNGGRVRCVYDTWYWGTDDRLEDNPNTTANEKMIFTYGDKQR